jgi:Nucleotide-diphospho-sugar transferase
MNTFGRLLPLALCSTIALHTNNAPLKVYAIYTPSHKVLVDNWFLPSFRGIDDNLVILLKELPQTCPQGTFYTSGWTSTTIKKIEYIVQAIKENWGGIFVFSDVDIQAFGPINVIIHKLMRGYDLRIQRNAPGIRPCTGFFACRANARTLALWTDALEYMRQNPNISDQRAFNHCLLGQKNKHKVVWNFLPDMFYCPGLFTGKRWKPGSTLKLPHSIVVHHANWTRGVKSKIMQLHAVKKLVKCGKLKIYQSLLHKPYMQNLGRYGKSAAILDKTCDTSHCFATSPIRKTLRPQKIGVGHAQSTVPVVARTTIAKAYVGCAIL